MPAYTAFVEITIAAPAMLVEPGYHLAFKSAVAMSKEYVEQHDGGYWIAGSRISLDSIVYAWHCGASPESIQRSFPLLTLEQVYGAITFYLLTSRR